MKRAPGESALAIGERVVIVSRDHPWYGSSGEVVDTFTAGGLEWVVRVDGIGASAACASADLRRVEDL